ncbi:MAG: sulfatase-like hydrolase/transferase, partial [Chitinivibrionales bacterium]|nr:sulfatase-like hydrolase/transferase [Chitinivibrionales bacterium]
MADKPNVLFVVVDDLRPQLGCYGQEWIISPHTDRLAEEGILFERAYCQQALCAPSRASVLSGCRPDTIGIYDLFHPVRSTVPDILTLPQHFKNNGYETVSIGKVYHHADDDLQGWSAPPFQSVGDWRGFGYLTDEAIEIMTACDVERRKKKARWLGIGPAFEAAEVGDEAYQDGADAAAAIKELNRLAKLHKPFFCALGFHKPHLPFNAPKRYWDIYKRGNVPLALNPFAPENVTEFSLEDFGELRSYFGMPQEGPVPESIAQTLVHGYAACVTYMDTQFGKVLDELDRLKLRDNTIIIYWGDHGWKLGEHASWCKHSNFEIDARAPMIVSVPGTGSKRARTQGMVEFVDIYPTLVDLCDLEIPEHCEGLSFAPLIHIPGQKWKDAAFSQFPRRNDQVMGYTVRTEQYRYT